MHLHVTSTLEGFLNCSRILKDAINVFVACNFNALGFSARHLRILFKIFLKIPQVFCRESSNNEVACLKKCQVDVIASAKRHTSTCLFNLAPSSQLCFKQSHKQEMSADETVASRCVKSMHCEVNDIAGKKIACASCECGELPPARTHGGNDIQQ